MEGGSVRHVQKLLGIETDGKYGPATKKVVADFQRQHNLDAGSGLGSVGLKTPGLVLTWEKTSTRLGSIYGHTAITTGDGRSSVSDFIERNTLAAGGRSGLKIFRPTL
jgi:peptidoglycan hydrolase-like protein with peptidoglycan-binding domain